MSCALGARAIGAAVVVAAVVGVVFPYVTLRVGFGPNVSLFATLLGFVVLSLARARGTAALHAAHAAGVAAGQTAFMGVALAAFEMLRARHAQAFDVHPSRLAIFAWLASAGALGVLLALPLRRHYLHEEKLRFAAGTAAAETILALERRGGSKKTIAIGASFAGAVLLTCARPAGMAFGPLGIGSGMLIGVRVGASMAAGALVAALLPREHAAIAASSLMVAGGLTTIALRAPALFAAARRPIPGRSGRALVVFAAATLALLCAVDRFALGLPVWVTLASVVVAAPLLLVGTRVLGETNWAPVASLATVAQAVLAAIVPGCLLVNMVGSAVAGAIPNGGQHMMQSLRAATIVGARARDTVIAQLIGVAVGALALSVGFPMLVARFGVGEDGLSSPFSVSWAALAEVLSGGLAALPAQARIIAAVAAVAGVALALLEARFGPRVPSATALGVGVLVTPGVAASVFVGSAIAHLASRFAPRASSAHGASIATGLVAGEAVAACVGAIATALGGPGA